MNLNNPNERLLTTMLYYEPNQSPDLLKVYTPRQNGEDVTVYLSDFFMISGTPAMSISESGYAFIPITDIYFDDYYGNSDVFLKRRTESLPIISILPSIEPVTGAVLRLQTPHNTFK
ncbi:hypothetical protein LEP1GSC060_1718 [Leptospira weilii serovar Ranarum str. ICFT]|uniref:Uncharacterized protein n=1 Tax=Leptospira weilii serovar Ranarum str. ICFT TaxID=1218598 RepID=N1WCT6_9LEPT|nr:hypothetical protein LEP1GSC060_1718 [Leptospira weilii serovar Ranarum str. ICFT]